MKLTEAEVIGLSARYNLSDAHTHQTPSAMEWDSVLGRLPQIAERARGSLQRECERGAQDAFFALCGTNELPPEIKVLQVYSSSASLEIVANWLRLTGVQHALVPEPTFDNIPDILTRHGVFCRPFDSETTLAELVGKLESVGQQNSVLVLVNPNNPTGHVWSTMDILTLGETCARTGSKLIIDASFRLFDARCRVDWYPALISSGCEFLIIEDTGKVWPTLDLKASFLAYSVIDDRLLRETHEDFLLNVSPLVLLLIRHYSEFSRLDGLHSVCDLIEENRRILRSAIDNAGLGTFEFPENRTSVELIRLPSGLDSDPTAAWLLEHHGVATLSSRAFYWTGVSPVAPSSLRIALARDEDYFRQATSRLIEGLGFLRDRSLEYKDEG